MMRPLWMRRAYEDSKGTVTPRRTGCQTSARRADPTEVLGEICACDQPHVHRDVGVPCVGRAGGAGRGELQIEGVRSGDVADEVHAVAPEHDALVCNPIPRAVI